MQICHSLGAQRWFRHKTKKPVTASLLLHCIDGCCCSGYENELCDAVFQVSDWSFLVLNSNGNVCHWIPKVIWPRMDRFWVSCSKMAPFLFFVQKWIISFTSNLYVLKSARIAHLLFFLMTSRFSTFTLRGILVCSLKMLVPFNQRIFYFRLVRFSEAMQRYFPYFRLFHFLCFLGSIGKTLWLLLKTIESIFNLCINCLLRFHFGYCNNGALKNVNGAG